MRNHHIYIVGISLLFAGCATSNINDKATQKKAEEVSVSDRLAKSAEKVQAMMVDLSNLSAPMSQPPAAKSKADSVDQGSLITISWQGDAKPLVERLAQLRGYKFLVTGKPYMAVPVVIEAKEKPFLDVLADIGAQMGKRADLVLKAGVLELRYRDPV